MLSMVVFAVYRSVISLFVQVRIPSSSPTAVITFYALAP